MGYDPGASSCLAGLTFLDGFVNMARSNNSNWFAPCTWLSGI
jgi:hypothetical protein